MGTQRFVTSVDQGLSEVMDFLGTRVLPLYSMHPSVRIAHRQRFVFSITLVSCSPWQPAGHNQDRENRRSSFKREFAPSAQRSHQLSDMTIPFSKVDSSAPPTRTSPDTLSRPSSPGVCSRRPSTLFKLLCSDRSLARVTHSFLP